MRNQGNITNVHAEYQQTLANALPSPSFQYQIPVMTNSTNHENNRLATLIKSPSPKTSLTKPAKSTFDRNFRNVVDLLDYAKRLNEDALVDLRIRRPRVAKKAVVVKEESSAVVTRKGYRTIKEDLQARFAMLRDDCELYKDLEQKVLKLTTKTKPNQDLVIRNVGGVGKNDKEKIKVVAEKHNMHMKEVLERKKKIDKIDLKKRLRVMEEKEKRSEQAIANERDFGGSLKEVQEKWFTVFYCAVKVAKIKEVLQQGHVEKFQRLKENRGAIVIQRWYRSIVNQARNVEVNNALAVISYHFKKYYKSWKLKRLQKASNIIQTFFKEVYDVSKLLKIVKKYRLSVIKSQKYATDFLTCRDAKVKVIAKYWDSLETTWWLQRQKGKGAAPNSNLKNKKKGKKEEIVRLEEKVKLKFILDNLISRRKAYWKNLIKNEQDDSKVVMISPSPVVTKKPVPVFKLLPKQEELFAIMEEAYASTKLIPKTSPEGQL